MDYRQRAFKTKFANAAKCLGVKPEQVVSLKFREIVHSYREYDLLMDMLEREVGIVRSPAHEDLQGQGHLLQDGKNQILVVQHETGLEILYIFGSIASLLGLIPLVLQCWSRLGGHSRRPHADHLQQIETRRLDKKGHLVEDPAHGLLGGLLSPFAFLNSALTDAVEAMDSELQSLRTELQALMGRVEFLEKNQRKAKSRPTNTKPSRKERSKTNRK